MNTHMSGCQLIFRFLYHFVLSYLVTSIIRKRLLDLLVTGSFPDQFYRVRREVIENKVDYFIM